MLLESKSAVIYGAGGSIGGAVARTFAREGARVFLAGRTAASLEAVADQIRAVGGVADTAQVDALDERAVDEHADLVASRAGALDISFNLISHGYVQGTPMAEMEVDDYVGPVLAAVRSTFLTWRAAARHMRRQGSGVILAFGGEGHPVRGYHLGSLQVACTRSSRCGGSSRRSLELTEYESSPCEPGVSPTRSPWTCQDAKGSRLESRKRRCWGVRRRSRTSATWPRSWLRTRLER